MDFRAQLASQLEFIQSSCDLYDVGKVREGVRIATALRVLFHQTRKSTSVLTHLSAIDIALLSTCDIARPRQRHFAAMTNIELDPLNKRMEWIPNLHVDYEAPSALQHVVGSRSGLPFKVGQSCDQTNGSRARCCKQGRWGTC